MTDVASILADHLADQLDDTARVLERYAQDCARFNMPADPALVRLGVGLRAAIDGYRAEGKRPAPGTPPAGGLCTGQAVQASGTAAPTTA